MTEKIDKDNQYDFDFQDMIEKNRLNREKLKKERRELILLEMVDLFLF